MDVGWIIEQAGKVRTRIGQYAASHFDSDPGLAAKAQVCEFLRVYAGPRSSFFLQAREAGGHPSYLVPTLVDILSSFIEYLEGGLDTGLSPQRQAQLDVVSDYLEQANAILDAKKQHPAAAAMLIGASLEEFLRNWAEAEDLQVKGKPSIASYAAALREAELISKQDVKDITSWGGIRNHAAHGNWDEVSDAHRIRLMLEGVNLFMRQELT
jgi:hypothetical protein